MLLAIQVESEDRVDEEEIDQLSRQLRRELLELEVARVDPAPSEATPPESKAGDPVAIGALLVSLMSSPELLAAIVGKIQAMLSLVGRHSVRLEIDGDALEVSGVSSREQRRLIEIWIDRHTRR
jgi:hypothetical protein